MTTLMICVCCQSWPATSDDLCEDCLSVFAAEPVEPPKHADYRLTADDETVMRAAVHALYAAMADSRRPGAFDLTADQRGRLRRVAARTIGCTMLDLRDCERIWIDELIADVSSPF